MCKMLKATQIAATITNARKESSRLSWRVSARRNSLRRLKKRSITFRAQLRASARGRAALEDLLQGSIIPPAAETAVYRLMWAESRRQIAPARTAAGKPQDAVEMCANIFLRTAGMRDRDKRPDQFPFLIGKFITTGFHVCHFFLPSSYHLFVSFSCIFRYF